jgi:predicted GNAT family acetyltransferase
VSDAADNDAVVTHSETARRGEFRIGQGAEMTYTRPGADVMKVNHTEVDKRLRGNGLAHQLYYALVAFAREHQRKVIAVCPFVAAMFEQHPEDADVLAT